MWTTELYEAIEKHDNISVEGHVYNELQYLIKAVLDRDEDFPQKVRFLQSVSGLASRQDGVDPKSINYQLGMLAGVVMLCTRLCQDTNKQEDVIEVLSKHRVNAYRILRAILIKDTGDGVRHKDLAEDLGMKSNNLSNQMKYIVETEAVMPFRIGRSTYYSLTDAGRRYIKRVESLKTDVTLKRAIINWPDLAMMVEEIHRELKNEYSNENHESADQNYEEQQAGSPRRVLTFMHPKEYPMSTQGNRIRSYKEYTEKISLLSSNNENDTSRYDAFAVMYPWGAVSKRYYG